MKCVKFVTLIPNYFEEDIASEVKIEMDNHISNCKSCREKFEERKELLDTFKYVLTDEEIQIKSRKYEIINNINNSKYTGSIPNKTFYNLYTKRGAFIGVVAAVFLMFVIFKYGGNVYSAANQYSTNKTERNKVVENVPEKAVPAVTPVPSSPIKIKFNEISKELLNPTGDGISATVNSASRKKLVEMISKMKELPIGVGPWRIIYCNNEKMMFYNYGHMIAYNYNEKEKGIYSILAFTNLKVGSYQGSQIINFSSSPDGNYLIIGTLNGEQNVTSNKSLYLYDLNNALTKEIATNFNMNAKNVTWYNNVGDASSKWVVSAKDDKSTVLWDVDNAKALEKLPIDVKEIVKENKFLNYEDLSFTDDKGNITKLVAEAYIDTYWFKDNNTLIAVQFVENMENLKLMDFQVVEINISDKTGKVTFRP
jgi:hypothetical protein